MNNFNNIMNNNNNSLLRLQPFPRNNFIFIVYVVSILVLIYIASGFNENYFRLIHFIFFLSFTISLYGFYLQEKENINERNLQYITNILVQVYHLESFSFIQDHDSSYPFQLLLVLEKIFIFDPTLIQPDRLGLRLQHLIQQHQFEVFWSSNASLYSPPFRHFVNFILSSSQHSKDS
jgi:hypothetical protein